VWVDVNPGMDIHVPLSNGRIRIKVLKLPPNVRIKKVMTDKDYNESNN
jgi:hypothetical protein